MFKYLLYNVFKNILIIFFKMIEVVSANSTHCKMILDWKNDITSRKNSINTEIISFENHEKWYNNYLKKNPLQLLICKLDNDCIGMVRFDNIFNKKSYKISINLNPLFRGKKLSALCLKNAIELFIKHHECEYIYAEIKPQNIASIKCFEKNNFTIFQNTMNSNSNLNMYCLDLT